MLCVMPKVSLYEYYKKPIMNEWMNEKFIYLKLYNFYKWYLYELVGECVYLYLGWGIDVCYALVEITSFSE